MLADKRARWELGAAIAVAVAVRLPFWLQACRIPLDADAAIVGLMARHGGASLTLWGQPYGSPLESWLALPLLAIFGSRNLTLRLLYFGLGLALVPLAYALAGRLERGATLPAALLVACPPAYMLLLSSLPPPLYPSVLVACALLLLGALELRRRLVAGEPAVALACAWGGLAGIALWTHLMCASAVAAGLLMLAPPLLRRRLALLALVAVAAVGAGPLLFGLWEGQIFHVVRLSRPQLGLLNHFVGLLLELHRPLRALLGASVPVIPDQRAHLEAPMLVVAALAVLWLALAARGSLAARESVAGRLILAAAAFAVVVFLLPARSAAHTIRFLTPLYVPLAVLAGAAAARSRWARVAVFAAAALHLVGASQLLGAWQQAIPAGLPPSAPDLAPVRHFLEAHGIDRAYAGYEAAYRLTWESGERMIVSQPWNQRFPRHPLPYLDELRQAKRLAWVLTPQIRSDLPTPDALEQQLRAIGAEWKRAEVGPAVVYYDFTPVQPQPTLLAGRSGPASTPPRR